MANLAGSICGLFRVAADHRDLGAQLGHALGNTQVDAAGAARDEGHFAVEQIVFER